MKVNDRLVFGILIPSFMEEAAEGARFLRLLCDTLPEFSPEFYNNYEPINKPFTSVEDAIDAWKCPFLWKHKSGVKAEGSAWMMNPGCHSGIYARSESKRCDYDAVIQFVKLCAIQFNAHLGYIHMITQAEVERVPYDAWYPVGIGITTHDLKKGLPNLCWGMVWGKPYLELIGKRVLSSVPASVEHLSDDQLYIQLTDNVVDLREDYATFNQHRDMVINHIGRQYFAGHDDVVAPAFDRILDSAGR